MDRSAILSFSLSSYLDKFNVLLLRYLYANQTDTRTVDDLNTCMCQHVYVSAMFGPFLFLSDSYAPIYVSK